MYKIAFILCGGKGTRFRPVSLKPKILANFRGKPFIDWIIDYLIGHKFDEIIFSLGYKSDEVLEYLNRIKKDISITYLVEDFPLGTGGAIKSFFDTYGSKEIFIFNGDTFFSDKLPNRLFSPDLENRFVCIFKRFEVNDRYGDFSLVSDRLLIKRGTAELPIYDSQVYCGSTNTFVNFVWWIKPPFSTEDLFVKQIKNSQCCK